MTPVGAVARGLAAAAVGTLAMDLLLFARYKRGDGKSGFRTWELSSEIESWEQAPAPAQVGKRLFGGGTHLGRTQMMRDDEQAKLAARIGAHFDSLDAKLAKVIELTVAMKNRSS